MRRVSTLDQQRREAKLAKAAKEVERVLRRHGDDVAGGVVRRLQRDIAELQASLQEVLRSMPELERRHREKVKEANREVALYSSRS